MSVKVKAKTAMDCMGVSRSVGQEFEMSESDAVAHQIAGLVDIIEPNDSEKAKAEAEAKAKADKK